MYRIYKLAFTRFYILSLLHLWIPCLVVLYCIVHRAGVVALPLTEWSAKCDGTLDLMETCVDIDSAVQ